MCSAHVHFGVYLRLLAGMHAGLVAYGWRA